MMKLKRMNWQMLVLIACLFSSTAYAQTSGDIQLQIRLRYSDGTAVTDETVILQRLPEGEAQACKTNTIGECTWQVRHGLYQLIFERPLDDVSAVAVSEGGLRGFGITVGDASITYHFTFYSDGHVYFDAAPEAAVPSPIIPEGDILQGGIVSTPPQPVMTDAPIEETPMPEQAVVTDTAVRNPSPRLWRFILLICGGLIIGGGFHLWSRQSTNRKSKIKNRKSESRHD